LISQTIDHMPRHSEEICAAVSPGSFAANHGWPLRVASLVKSQQRVLSTLAASLAMYGAFAFQGILLARILGRHGRGEYATSVLFPQI
jgi:hypothetical protein